MRSSYVNMLNAKLIKLEWFEFFWPVQALAQLLCYKHRESKSLLACVNSLISNFFHPKIPVWTNGVNYCSAKLEEWVFINKCFCNKIATKPHTAIWDSIDIPGYFRYLYITHSSPVNLTVNIMNIL